MPNTQEYITAKGDSDLLSRLIARAEMMNVDDPANWVQINMSKLIQASIAGPDDTIVSVFSFAKQHREDYIAAIPPAPGADLAAVTDAHLTAAINAVRGETPTTSA